MKHDQINLYSLFNTIDTDADVIAKEQIVPLEFKAFVHANSKLSGGSDWDYKTRRYGRDKSEYQIYSMIARITDNVVYVRDFMTYPFLYVCGSVKEADKLYKAHVDKNSYDFTVTATDNKAGTILINNGASEVNAGIKLVNTYEANGKAKIEATKHIDGCALTTFDEGAFQFKLTGDKLTGGEIVANGANGIVSFSEIQFTQADLEGVTPAADGSRTKTFNYTIEELGFAPGHALPNISFDNHKESVTVTVFDKGDGSQLVCTTYYDSDGASFTNTYDASGSTTFGGTKKLEGRTLTDKDQWSFSLAPVNGAPLRDSATSTTSLSSKTVKNNGGSYSFGTFYYKLSDLANTDDEGNVTGYADSKTFEYTITESGSIANVTNDSKSVRTIKVTVTQEKDDNGNLTGRLVVTPAEGTDDGNFVNTYTTSEKTQFQVSKTLDGRDWADADKFSFTLAAETEGAKMPAGDGSKAEVSKPASGKTAAATFGEITYAMTDAGENGAAKDYIYKITEVEPATKIAGVTYDTDPVYVKVSVSYNAATGKLTVTSPAYYSDKDCTEPVVSASFTNTYEAAGTLTLTGTKAVEGGLPVGEDLSGFRFTVREGNKVVSTGVSDAKGYIAFAPITYAKNATADQTGSHTYTVTEDAEPSKPYVSNTDAAVTVKVNVTDSGDGTLAVENAQTGDIAISFTNTRDRGDLEVSKKLVSSVPADADRDFTFTVTLSDKSINGTYGKMTFTDGVASVALKGGETKIATGLPAGITYTVEEAANADFTTTSEGAAGTITTKKSIATFTNTREVTEATITKVWDDAQDQDGKRPAELKVALSDGTVVTLNKDNGWTATVKDLPRYENGREVTYTWSEVSVPEGYTLTDTTTKGTVTTLTNTYKSDKTTTTTTTTTQQRLAQTSDLFDPTLIYALAAAGLSSIAAGLRIRRRREE